MNTNLKFSNIPVVEESYTEPGVLPFPRLVDFENIPQIRPLTEIKPTATRSIIALGILISFQILDGVFTYVGTLIHGLEIEGNPLVYKLIEHAGAFLGISIAKLFAIAAILFLWNLRSKVTWVPKSIELISVYYLVFAIIPWTLLLAGIV